MASFLFANTLKRSLKIFILSFVLLVPCLWYLFLQGFGENRFELPRFTELPEQCMDKSGFQSKPFLVVGDSVSVLYPNEWSRVERALGQREVSYFVDESCTELLDFLLVDKSGLIRGKYGSTRADVDRLITELDVYLAYEYAGK